RQFRQSLALGGDAKERCLRALRLGPRRHLAGALRTLAVLMRSFQRHVPPLVRDQCPAARLWQRRAPAHLAGSLLTPAPFFLPSPLVGGGWGRGSRAVARQRVLPRSQAPAGARPRPLPPPTRGGGIFAFRQARESWRCPARPR